MEEKNGVPKTDQRLQLAQLEVETFKKAILMQHMAYSVIQDKPFIGQFFDSFQLDYKTIESAKKLYARIISVLEVEKCPDVDILKLVSQTLNKVFLTIKNYGRREPQLINSIKF